MKYGWMIAVVMMMIGAGLFVYQQSVAQEVPGMPIEEALGEVKDHNNLEQVRALNYKAVGLLGENKFEEAFKLWGKSSVLKKEDLIQLELQVSQQYKEIVGPSYGKHTGTEILKEEIMGTRLYKVVIADYRQEHVIIWNMIYFEVDGQWKLNNITFNDKLTTYFTK